ncbi:MAG: enoyl-CoA hydratase-related protein [Acidobacteriota bacterium]
MEYENLNLDLRGNVLWITIDRPKKLNALNVATVGEIHRAIGEAAKNSEVWAVCVTGAGDRSFVAGADIEELNTLGPVEAKDFAERGQAVFSGIERMKKPVVAAVNGFALGGGCELAMACHFRIATTAAVFGQPEVKLGLIPGYGGTQRLPRLVGRGRAMELLLSGRNVSADEAERIGLVNRVCEPDELEVAVGEFLKPILRNGPLAVAHCIEAVSRGLGLSLDEGCAVEASLFGLGASSPEMTEGTAAFLEKRRADFRGGS